MKKSLVDQIDALLPQTQCELCEYPGCRPYAQAIVDDGAPVDRCLPGGVRVLKQLGQLLDHDVAGLLHLGVPEQREAEAGDVHACP